MKHGIGTEAVVVAGCRQLFLDDHVVHDVQGLRRRVHPGRKYEGGSVLSPTPPETQACMRAGVVYNPWKKLFEMYYSSSFADLEYVSPINLSYARSEDGVHWEKPALGGPKTLRLSRFEDATDELLWSRAGSGLADKAREYYAGLADTSLLFPQTECQGIICTPDDPDPERLYKGLIFGGTIITSPDGIHWRFENTFWPGQLGTLSYDADRKLYIASVGIPPYAQGADWDWRRSAGLLTSQDLVTWTSPTSDQVFLALPLTAREIDATYQGAKKAVRGSPYKPVAVQFAPDSADDALAYARGLVRKETHGELAFWHDVEMGEAHIHDVTIFPYEGVYIAFVCKLDNISYNTQYGDEGQMYPELAFSRDLAHWTRYREVVIPPGPPGAFDGACIDSPKALVVGDEIRVYTQGSAWTHGWPNLHPAYAPKTEAELERLKRLLKQFPQPSGTGLSKWRLDGFVSVDPEGDQGGALTTKRLVFTGRQLEVNADAGAGQVKVEIQDPGGEALPGFSMNDCDGLTGDAVHHIFSWKGKSDLTLLAGRPVRLRFSVRQASLYAFQFVGLGPSVETQVFTTRPWDHVDLEEEIEVGEELPTEDDYVWRVMQSGNEICVRCGVPIACFDPVRAFSRPRGEEGVLYFHEKCAGRTRQVE